MDLAIENYTENQSVALFFPAQEVQPSTLLEYERTNFYCSAKGVVPEEKYFSIMRPARNSDSALAVVAAITFTNMAVDALVESHDTLNDARFPVEDRSMPLWAIEYGLKPFVSDKAFHFFHDNKNAFETVTKICTALKESLWLMRKACVTPETYRMLEEKKKTLHFTVICDAKIQAYLNYLGKFDTDNFPFTVKFVSSVHTKLKGQLYLSISLHDKTVPEKVEQAFGALLYNPSSRLVKSKDNLTSDVLLVKARTVAGLPILSRLSFTLKSIGEEMSTNLAPSFE